ncbi:hypothetical protein C8F01DRAFT_1092300 [Mycena amicta]|nr:hypothetical protein C8F01DRAFT_1092300 [Mycena amicta]
MKKDEEKERTKNNDLWPQIPTPPCRTRTHRNTRSFQRTGGALGGAYSSGLPAIIVYSYTRWAKRRNALEKKLGHCAEDPNPRVERGPTDAMHKAYIELGCSVKHKVYSLGEEKERAREKSWGTALKIPTLVSNEDPQKLSTSS